MFVLACIRNPIEDREINGRVLNKLNFFSGGVGVENEILYSVEKDYLSRLKTLAEKLGIADDELENKSASEVEKLISDKAEVIKDENTKNKKIVDKIKDEVPGMISDGKVNENKLAEVKTYRQIVKSLIGSTDLAAMMEKPKK